MVIINKWYICGMEGEYGYYDDGDSKMLTDSNSSIKDEFNSAARGLTFGEKLVGITFNPGNDDKVNKAKQLCADLADLLNYEYLQREESMLRTQLFNHAVGEIKDNVVNGTYHIIQGPPYNQVKIYIMFSINGEEFTTTRDIHIGDMLKSGGDKFDIAEYKVTFEKQVKQTILWYMLQYFATSVYKEITGYEVEKGEIVMAKGANPFK